VTWAEDHLPDYFDVPLIFCQGKMVALVTYQTTSPPQDGFPPLVASAGWTGNPLYGGMGFD